MNKHCKIFKENNFKIPNPNNDIMKASIACSHYFLALLNSGQLNCMILNKLTSIKDYNRKFIASTNATNTEVTVKQAVTSFLDWADKNEDKWNEKFEVYKTFFLHDKFPCKIK